MSPHHNNLSACSKTYSFTTSKTYSLKGNRLRKTESVLFFIKRYSSPSSATPKNISLGNLFVIFKEPVIISRIATYCHVLRAHITHQLHPKGGGTMKILIKDTLRNKETLYYRNPTFVACVNARISSGVQKSSLAAPRQSSSIRSKAMDTKVSSTRL